MKSVRMLILLAACGVVSTSHALWAAEPAPAKPATPAASESTSAAAAKQADESAAPKTDEDSKDDAKAQAKAKDPASEEAAQSKPAATTADKKGSSPQRFVPSEQVRADFDVSFPIDI